MKRVVLIALFFVLIGLFVTAEDPPAMPDYGEPDDLTDRVPIDPDTGEIDFDDPINKTKAEMRVEEINEYVGPFTKFLFNSELTLSWIFVFSLVLWVLLIELILVPVSEVFDFNFWLSLLTSIIIATISMRSFGDNFVEWMNSLATTWWIGLIVLAASVTAGVVYTVVMRAMGHKVGKWKEESKKVELEQDKAVIHAHSNASRKELGIRKKK